MARTNLSTPVTYEKSDIAVLRVTIARIYRALRHSASSGITASQISVLFRIEQNEPVRMGVLAQLERITPASLSKVVDSLESLQLVEREPDPLDGRVTLLAVARAGRDLIDRQRSASTRALEAALTEMDQRQRELLLESLPALQGLAEVLLTQVESP